MGFVLAQIAVKGSAGIDDFTEEALEDPELRAFHDKVEMVLDPEVDAAYPRRWIGLVDVKTKSGETITSRVEVPKGDPDNTLSRSEIEDKAKRLVAYGGGVSDEELDLLISRSWNLSTEKDVRNLLPENGRKS